MDDQSLALYARGMSTPDIVDAFREMYDADVSATLVSKVTEQVLKTVAGWQNRSLDRVYPTVYLDCIVLKIGQNKRVINKVMYVALAVNMEGQKELKGFPEPIAAEYPQAKVQLCIVHMVRNSLKYVSWKDYKAVTAELKGIYTAATETAARTELEGFAGRWDKTYPQISKSWATHWPNLITLFEYPPEIRKVIYTTNAIESLNIVIRKATAA